MHLEVHRFQPLFVNNALNCNSKCFLFFKTVSWQTLKMQTEKRCQVMSILELWEAKEPDVSAISFKKITRVKPNLTATWCIGKIKKKQSVAVARHARLVESAVIAMHLFRDHKHSRHWNCVGESRYFFLLFLDLFCFCFYLWLIFKLHCFDGFNPVSLPKLPLQATLTLMWLCICVTDTGQQPEQIPSGHQCLSAVVTSLSCTQHSVGVFFQGSLAWGAAAGSEHTPYQYLKSY